MGEILIREALAEDALALAEVAIMAGHGVMELLYEGLLPEKSLAETIIDRRIAAPTSFSALRRWRVATDAAGGILGALNSFPSAVLLDAPPDPLLDAARLAPLAALSELEAACRDSYSVNIIAVFPRHRGSGAGAALMREAERLARAEGFRRMSLCTFESDPALLGFYRRHGFEVQATCPIGAHPAFTASGNFALMTRHLES